MKTKDPYFWIEKLQLLPHPEGGYYREIFSSQELIHQSALPERFTGQRKVYTSIYFLLKDDEVSHLHKIKSDEIWCFHAGSALDIHIIDEIGNYSVQKLGLDPENNEMPQQIVKAGLWFGASLNQPKSFALVSCFVAPGFDFEDFELAKKEELLDSYPKHDWLIKFLTVR